MLVILWSLVSVVVGAIDKGQVEGGRMFGLDTGNSNTDFEAGMWLMALVATLAAAVPVAFLSPDLGFKRKKRQATSAEQTNTAAWSGRQF